MKPRLNYSALLLAVLFFSPAFAKNGSKQASDTNGTQQKPSPKLDRYGDPLPDGAIAKFGDHRFRHVGRTGSIDFSPNGSLASGSEEGTIIIWNTVTGLPKRKFQPHDGKIESLSFSSDGKMLASYGRKKIVVSDVASGKEVWNHKFEEDQTGIVRFSPKGTYLAFFGDQGSICLWDINKDKLIINEKTKESAEYISFSPDNKYVAFGSKSNDPAVLWDLRTVKKENSRDIGLPERVEFLPDGKHVFSRKVVQPNKKYPLYKKTYYSYWAIGNKNPLRTIEITSRKHFFAGYVRYLQHAVSRTDSSIVHIGDRGFDSTVSPYRIIDPDTRNTGGTAVSASLEFLERKRDSLFNNRTKRCITGIGVRSAKEFLEHGSGFQRFTYLLNFETGKYHALDNSDGGALTAAFSRDGKTVAVGCPDSIRLWDIETGKERLSTVGHHRMVDRVKFSPDGKFLASCGNDGVFFWNLASGESQSKFRSQHRNLYWPTDIAHKPETPGWYAITYASSFMAVCRADLEYDTFQSELIFSDLNVPLERFGKSPRAIAFTKNGIAVIGYASTDTKYKKRSKRLDMPPIWMNAIKYGRNYEYPMSFQGDMDVFSLQFSPDDKLLVLGGHDKERKLPVLRIYETTVGLKRNKKNLQLFNGELLKFPKNKKDGYYLRLIEVSKNKEDHIESLVFLPDGINVVIGGKKTAENKEHKANSKFKGLVEIWDITTGKRQRTFDVPAPVRCIASSPDGKMIATACKDNLARIYNAKTGELVAKLEGHRGPVRSVDFSPDGKLIATGSADTTVILWDVEKLLKSFKQK